MERLDVHAVWRPSGVTPAATRLFVEFLAGRLRVEDLHAPLPRGHGQG